MKYRWVSDEKFECFLKLSGEGAYYLELSKSVTKYGPRVVLKILHRGKRSREKEVVLVSFLEPEVARILGSALISLSEFELPLKEDVLNKLVVLVEELKKCVDILKSSYG